MEAAQTAWALRAWPLVWRSHYAADIAALWQFIDADNKRRTEAAQFAEAVRADEDKKRAKALDEVLPRLFRITGYAVDNYRTYAVTVTFHREMVEMAFVHGNSQEQIRWLAMDLSRRIEHELLTLNFARFRDPREREPSLANPFDPRAYYRPNDPIDPLAAGGPVTGGRR